jgi:hypothetical protein
MDPVAERYLVSHAEAAKPLRRAGYSEERIQELLRGLPDPIDSERAATKSSSAEYQCGS